MAKFKPVTLTSPDKRDTYEVTTKADYNYYVYGLGWRPEAAEPTAKRAAE